MTDIRQRFPDEEEQARTWLDSLQARLWTALPGTVEAVSFKKGVPYVSVQPAAQGKTVADDRTTKWHDLPLLPHVPVIFPRGGGFSLTFPISPGDECLLIFASRSIDEWWQSGKGQPAFDHRMHDLSDAFALMGATSQARSISSGHISASSTQLRSDDGETVFDLAAGQATFSLGGHPLMTLTPGSVTIDGTLTATKDVIGGNISLKSHTHSGVQPGGGSTGKPQ